jgi:hypothetical protein
VQHRPDWYWRNWTDRQHGPTGTAGATGPTGTTATVIIPPGSDPHVNGQVWNNAGVLTVSAG